MASNCVLLVEDETDIREMLTFSLERGGFKVVPAKTAEEALEVLNGRLPSVVIIDWMLPGMSGIDLARKLRRDSITSDLPLVMLTARGEESDKLKSFDAGIDDYVTKPFSPKELIARINALLRRTGTPEDGILTVGQLRLDTRGHQVSVNGDHVHVGPTEFRLLELLMRNPNRAFDRTQLLDRVWGRNVYVEERTVDVHVLRLRKALMPFGMDKSVETVRGIGYRLAPVPASVN